MKHGQNNNFGIRRDPKPIPKLSEKSALDSYKNVRAGISTDKNHSQVTSQIKTYDSNLNNHNEQLIKAASDSQKDQLQQPIEEVMELKKSAFLGKHIGMESRPVPLEIPQNEKVVPQSVPTSFSHAQLGNMESNPLIFGANIMQEQGIKANDIIIEKMKGQEYIDPNAEKVRLEREKEAKRRKMWQIILIVLIFVILITITVILYQLFGPNSQKKQLFCVTNYPSSETQASVISQKTYFYQKKGLYRLETQERYVFHTNEAYLEYKQNYISPIDEVKGITVDTTFDDKKFIFVKKVTYDYNNFEPKKSTIEIEVDSNNNDTQPDYNIDNQVTEKFSIEQVKQLEEETGFQCRIK